MWQVARPQPSFQHPGQAGSLWKTKHTELGVHCGLVVSLRPQILFKAPFSAAPLQHEGDWEVALKRTMTMGAGAAPGKEGFTPLSPAAPHSPGHPQQKTEPVKGRERQAWSLLHFGS